MERPRNEKVCLPSLVALCIRCSHSFRCQTTNEPCQGVDGGGPQPLHFRRFNAVSMVSIAIAVPVWPLYGQRDRIQAKEHRNMNLWRVKMKTLNTKGAQSEVVRYLGSIDYDWRMFWVVVMGENVTVLDFYWAMLG